MSVDWFLFRQMVLFGAVCAGSMLLLGHVGSPVETLPQQVVLLGFLCAAHTIGTLNGDSDDD